MSINFTESARQKNASEALGEVVEKRFPLVDKVNCAFSEYQLSTLGRTPDQVARDVLKRIRNVVSVDEMLVPDLLPLILTAVQDISAQLGRTLQGNALLRLDHPTRARNLVEAIRLKLLDISTQT